MGEVFSNNYETTLNGSITNVASTLTATSVTGAPTSGTFRLLLKAEGANTDEIVTVTSVSGSVFTISRATEAVAGSQVASAHASGAAVVHVLTTGSVKRLSPFGLDRVSFDGTYGDDFNDSTLNARWTRHVQGSGEETYQAGGNASALQVVYATGAAARYIYQTAPNGTNETWETCVSIYQETTTNQMYALLMVDTSGNGVAALYYDNTIGIYLANVATHTYTSVLTQNANLRIPIGYQQSGGRMWFRLRKATGLYAVSYSIDGETYSREITGTPTAFTPARVGIGRILGTTANDTCYWHWFDKTA